MAGGLLRFIFEIDGIDEVEFRLKKLGRDMNPEQNAHFRRTVVTVLLAEADKKLAKSARGGKVKGWAPMADFTKFVRARRQSKPNKKARLGVDSGRMRTKNEPFEARKGREFGIRNKLRRASIFNFGGTTKSNTVRIGKSTRKRGGKTHKVRAYKMKISGGKKVPARPFFPTIRSFEPLLKRIIADEEKRIAKG